MTQSIKIIPIIKVIGKPLVDRKCSRETSRAAPTPGPMSVPIPPSRIIKITSPDICHATSTSEATWKAIALRLPASPDKAADNIKAISLYRSGFMPREIARDSFSLMAVRI